MSNASDLSLHRQFVGFAFVGIVATFFHFGTLIGLVEGVGLGPVLASLAGYFVGGIVSYILSRRVAFASNRRHRDATWRFAIVAGVGFGLTALMMTVATGCFNWPYLPSQAVTTGIVVVWSFLAHRLWTFRTPPLA